MHDIDADEKRLLCNYTLPFLFTLYYAHCSMTYHFFLKKCRVVKVHIRYSIIPYLCTRMREVIVICNIYVYEADQNKLLKSR